MGRGAGAANQTAAVAAIVRSEKWGNLISGNDKTVVAKNWGNRHSRIFFETFHIFRRRQVSPIQTKKVKWFEGKAPQIVKFLKHDYDETYYIQNSLKSGGGWKQICAICQKILPGYCALKSEIKNIFLGAKKMNCIQMPKNDTVFPF